VNKRNTASLTLQKFIYKFHKKFINYIEVNFNLFIIPPSSKFYLSLILNSIIIKGEESLKGEGLKFTV